ncbi:MAG: hypothetical protein SXA11_06775 [Cyanobacteriota bacterium]|nr:hypothetical protein [Cyanobacteriota bacterium]
MEEKSWEKVGKKFEKDLDDNHAIIEKLNNAPFTIRERNGRYYVRACFTFDGQKFQKEFAMGHSLELTSLLALWQDIEKVKAGAMPIDSLDKWGKHKKKQSLFPKEPIDNKSISIGQAIALFKQDFWNKRSSDNLKAKSTWKNYQQVIDKIPQSYLTKTVSIENLTNLIINNSLPETRKRENWVLVCGILAKFAKIDDKTAIRELKGNRKPSRDRYIPSDREIIAVRNGIEDAPWRWVFGILAAYGLRPSELFHLNFTRFNEGIIKVGAETKTGERIIYPLLKNWHLDWELEKVSYPHNLIPEKLIHLSNQDKSRRITQKFKSLKFGFTPYALRDAYAIRGAVLGISPSIISQWMGHSLNVHFDSYQSYISEREWSQVWENLD